MTQISNNKQYDLEERCFKFTKAVHNYVRTLPRDIANLEIGKQVVRSAGSVGANYIEANEALSKKDFVMRVKISKKEAKETVYWLRLSISGGANEQKAVKLIQEATELMKIFGAILEKSK